MHLVFISHCIAALLEVNRLHVQVLEHERLVEKFIDAFIVVAIALVDIRHPSALSDFSFVCWLLRSVAGCVDVQDAGSVFAEFSFSMVSEFLAVIRLEGEGAVGPDIVPSLLSDIGVLVQELVLEHGHAVAGLIALVRIRAGVTHHDALQVYLLVFGSWKLVVVHHLVG